MHLQAKGAKFYYVTFFRSSFGVNFDVEWLLKCSVFLFNINCFCNIDKALMNEWKILSRIFSWKHEGSIKLKIEEVQPPENMEVDGGALPLDNGPSPILIRAFAQACSSFNCMIISIRNLLVDL